MKGVKGAKVFATGADHREEPQAILVLFTVERSSSVVECRRQGGRQGGREAGREGGMEGGRKGVDGVM